MRRRVATLATAAFMLALLVPAASASASSAIHVRPGQSIQAAIDSAPAGSTIYVARGTYPGSLDVARSLQLVGDHAVIVPAATNPFCLADWAFSGAVGICVHGAVDLETFAIAPISNVSIQGITVRDFAGPGIVVLGVDGFRAEDMVAANNGEMGLFINTVSNVSVLDSRSYGNGGDGLFVENSSAKLVISGSTAYGNLGSGIFFMNSLGGRIAGNDLHGNCAGIMVASVATYGPGSAVPSGDVSIQRNQVTANDRLCPAVPNQAPAYGGIGVLLIGAQNTTVADNSIRKNHALAGSDIHGGGIVVLDGAMFGAGVPTGNSIRSNRLSGNTPYDTYCDGSGDHNTVRGNSGTLSGC
jgi:parallel beta-helix repeat protein